MGKYDDRPYEVGKCKPPKHSQYKKGQTGNPKGRPKKEGKARYESLSDELSAAIDKTLTVTIDGRAQQLTRRETMIEALMKDILTGTPAYRQKGIQMLEKMGAFAKDTERSAPSAEDRRKFLQGLAEATKDYEAPRYKPQTGL